MEKKGKWLDKLIAATILKFLPDPITPNQITMFRFVSIPFIILFLSLNRYDIALGLFIVAALSDAVDGALARTKNKITDWGRFYDSIADKLLIFTTAAVVVLQYLHWHVFVAMLIPETFLLVGVYIKKYQEKRYVVEHVRPGKYKMFLQSVGVSLLLLHAVVSQPLLPIIAQYVLYASVILGFISFFMYRKALK
ncbi:CDP-alcohol phosphatidyltransferase family protein [Patescibacteria group bacterium AH-259-L07]|nr:CDP-alcohol phosphatidyltransferase family protein [Patescibacteria group bacterium AH-259-L07]